MMRTAYEGIINDDIPRPVLHLVKDLDGKHVDGHNRLRVESEKYAGKIESLEKLVEQHEEALKYALKRTTDVSSLRFTPATLAATVAICASIIGGAYASTWGIRADQSAMRSDIRDLTTMMASQQQMDQERNKNTTFQVVQLGDRVAALTQQMEALQNQLREISAGVKERNR